LRQATRLLLQSAHNKAIGDRSDVKDVHSTLQDRMIIEAQHVIARGKHAHSTADHVPRRVRLLENQFRIDTAVVAAPLQFVPHNIQHRLDAAYRRWNACIGSVRRSEQHYQQ
jgi:hypothetical protein